MLTTHSNYCWDKECLELYPVPPLHTFMVRTGKTVHFFIISETASAYDELLLNIDNLRGIAALRKGDWKLIKGEKISTQ